MGRARQTVERRQLGLMLQTMRLRADLSQKAAAEVIHRAQVRISHVEHGKGALKAAELTALLDFYGVTGEERETAMNLGIESRRRQRKRGFTDDQPDASRRLADLQATATVIRHYEYGLIPGPLQSPGYVESIVRVADGLWWKASSRESGRRIEFRREQQRRILTAVPVKKLEFVFTEEALRNGVGGEHVMQGQALHLLHLLQQREELSIRILPVGTRDNPAMGGGLVVLDFDSAPRIGFATALYGPSTYHDHSADTTPILRVFERVSELALSPTDTRALLISVLQEEWHVS